MRSSHTVLNLLAFACVLGWSAPAMAADPPPPTSKPNELSLGYAPRVVLRKDQIASPRQYVGGAWAAARLDYARTRGRNAHRIEVGFAQVTLRSQPDFDYLSYADEAPTTSAGTPITHVRLRYAYLRELPIDHDRLALRLGPGLDFDIQKIEYVHSPSSLGGYMGAFALDARAELELRPASRHRVRLTGSAPLFAWVTRSPYAINDDENIWANHDHNGLRTFFRYIGDGAMQTWNHQQAVRLDARYDFQFAEHWALTAGVHVRVLALSVPRPLLAQEYGGSLGITARF